MSPFFCNTGAPCNAAASGTAALILSNHLEAMRVPHVLPRAVRNKERNGAPKKHAQQHAQIGVQVPTAMAVAMVAMVMPLVTMFALGLVNVLHGMGEQVGVGNVQHNASGKGKQVRKCAGGGHAQANYKNSS